MWSSPTEEVGAQHLPSCTQSFSPWKTVNLWGFCSPWELLVGWDLKEEVLLRKPQCGFSLWKVCGMGGA